VRIGQSIGVNTDAPNATNFLQLFVTVSSIIHGLNAGGCNGFVPGNLVLIMAGPIIARDNRNPAQRDVS
jgi:hypothetical protein